MRILKILFFLIFTHSYFFSQTYYVSPTGNNSNDGSINSPWQTIAFGVSQLSAGNTLYLREGTYRETLTIDKDGS